MHIGPKRIARRIVLAVAGVAEHEHGRRLLVLLLLELLVTMLLRHLLRLWQWVQMRDRLLLRI